MDGLIENKTIEYLNLFRGTIDPDIVLNHFSPRKDYTYLVLPLYKNRDIVPLTYILTLAR